ncbi:MAG: ParB/RepB/Spo0J family partition protein [Syntrophomonadaceae bacterium]|nr:ParB/RepB/Spo0J family partition protein [Syntrophomonadaceae bacterium]
MPKKERGLGRGLEALLSAGPSLNDEENIQEIEVEQLKARSDQPRTLFQEESLRELALSIKEHGLLQPILAKPDEEGYQIIAGERRWRAAQMAGLKSIPVIVKDIEEDKAAEISLIENLQRDDLTPVEEARAYKMMMDRYNYTQETLAQRIGKSRSHVANMLRILALPEEVLKLLEEGKLSAGHARALLAIGKAGEQIKMAQAVAEDRVSVRQLEKKVKNIRSGDHSKGKPRLEKLPEVKDLEERLQLCLGTRAQVSAGNKGGKIIIEYYSLDDLERICDIIGI